MNAIVPITVSDLEARNDDEPRIKDIRLGERLGMAQPLNIRQTIEANRAELEAYGEVFTRRVKTGSKGGRPGIEYWLNEPQALLLCMFSRTDAASEVRRELIEVYMAWRHGKTPAAFDDTPAINRLAQDWAKKDFRRYQSWLVRHMKELRAVGWTDTADAALSMLSVDPALIGRPALSRMSLEGAEMKVPDGRYLLVVARGKAVKIENLKGASIVDGNDETNLYTFLREFVPPKNLHVALSVISHRCAVALKYGPKGAPVPESLTCRRTSAVN